MRVAASPHSPYAHNSKYNRNQSHENRASVLRTLWLGAQSITAGCIFPAADATAQFFDPKRKEEGSEQWDTARTLRWLFFGFAVQAPWNHVSATEALHVPFFFPKGKGKRVYLYYQPHFPIPLFSDWLVFTDLGAEVSGVTHVTLGRDQGSCAFLLSLPPLPASSPLLGNSCTSFLCFAPNPFYALRPGAHTSAADAPSLPPTCVYALIAPFPSTRTRPKPSFCALTGWRLQFFYVLLDGALPPTPDPLSTTTAVKVVVDQFVQAPIFTVIIFGVSSYIRLPHMTFISEITCSGVQNTLQGFACPIPCPGSLRGSPKNRSKLHAASLVRERLPVFSIPMPDP